MTGKLKITVLVTVLAVVHSASILDFLDWDDGKKLIELPEQRNTQPNRNCMCKGPACICCVDFNITFVDLGGPGCVHMKYLSPEDGFSVNVSYGKSLIHSSKIQGPPWQFNLFVDSCLETLKVEECRLRIWNFGGLVVNDVVCLGANPAPICLQVFGKFAQVCAKFNDLAPTADGLRGCLELGPKLFGETQLEFPIGCFKSTASGMEMEDPPAETEEVTTEEDSASEDSNDSTDFDAESFLLGIYQTAEQGMALLSSLLDIQRQNTTSPITTSTQKSEPQRRAPKNMKHPNLL